MEGHFLLGGSFDEAFDVLKGVIAGFVAKHFFQRCKLGGGWLVFIGHDSVSACP